MTDLLDIADDWNAPLRRDPAPMPWLGQAMAWGPAQGQGSKTAFIHPHAKRPNGSPVVVVTDANDRALKSWRQELVDAMQRTRPPKALDSPVAVSVMLYVPRPRAHYSVSGELKSNAPKLPASGRDIDKVARAILDAGQIACWWVNDARVVDLRIRRRYDDGIGERTFVWAWAVSKPDQEMPELLEIIDVGSDDEL